MAEAAYSGVLASVLAAVSSTLILRDVRADTLSIQRAQVDIAPPELLPLGGYTARGGKLMEAGGDPLFAQVAVLSNGDLKIAVVSIEMLTVPESLAREVRLRIPAGIKLFLIATHTHSAPDSQMLNDRMTFSIPGIASFKTRWLEWYAERIAGAVRLSLGEPKSTVERLLIRQSYLPLNRGRRPGAFPDPVATVVAYVSPGLTGQSGRSGVPNLWFHYAAHATFFGASHNRTSGDWPGAVAKAVGAPVLPGAIGDVSPRAPDDLGAEQKIDYFATLVNERFPVAFGRSTSVVPMKWQTVPISLAAAKPHPDFARANKIPDFLAQQLAEKFAPKEAVASAFRIGKLAVVGIPGEPTSHLGRRIRDYGRRLGFDPVLVCSHVNGWMGYILDPNDYARGGYEATLSMFGPNEGDYVVEAAKDALRRLSQAGPSPGR